MKKIYLIILSLVCYIKSFLYRGNYTGYKEEQSPSDPQDADDIDDFINMPNDEYDYGHNVKHDDERYIRF